jgi:hypothetical protein
VHAAGARLLGFFFWRAWMSMKEMQVNVRDLCTLIFVLGRGGRDARTKHKVQSTKYEKRKMSSYFNRLLICASGRSSSKSSIRLGGTAGW